MGSYPAGYNAEGLEPLIIIKDIDGVEQFRWEADKVVAGPPGTRDFSLDTWKIDGGVNTNHGLAQIVIDDRTNQLTDLTDSKRRSKIKNSWEIQISLGKSNPSQSWFTGIIVEPQVMHPGPNLQKLGISAIGWGVRTANRVSKIRRFQKKLANGLDLDETDVNAKISELFKDVLVDTDHLAHSGLGQEAITVTDIEDIDVKLPDYQRDFQTFGLLLNELANMGGAFYGVKPTKDAYLRRRGTVDSGFLISNHFAAGDPFALLTQNWSQNKLMALRNAPLDYRDSAIGFGYTVLHGVGAQHDTLDHDKTDANALLDLSSLHFAFPVVATKDNFSKVGMFLSKTGTIVDGDDMHVCIVRQDSATGGPNEAAISQRIIVKGSRLERELASSGYFEVSFNKLFTSVDEKVFVLIAKFPDAVNFPSLDYQTAVGEYWDSPDGVTWTQRVGEAKMRSYTSKTMHIIATNTVTQKSKRNKEDVISLVDFQNEEAATRAMEAFSDVRGKEKRIYNQIVVSAPDDPIDLGKTARLLDKKTGLDATVDIVGYSISGSAYGRGNRGATDMILTVEEMHN